MASGLYSSTSLRCAGLDVFPCKAPPARFVFTWSGSSFKLHSYCRSHWLQYRHDWTDGQSRAFWRPITYRGKWASERVGRRLVVKAVW